MLQRLHDQHRFEVAREGVGNVGLSAGEPRGHLALEHAPPVAVARGSGRALAAHLRGQVVHVDHLARRHDRDPVAHVLDLPHVAWPVLGREELDRALREALAIDTQVARALGEEVAREHRDVLAPLAQRRQAKADHVEAVVEVLAKQPLLHPRLELLVGGRDHAHVGRERHVAAHAVELAVGQHPQ